MSRITEGQWITDGDGYLHINAVHVDYFLGARNGMVAVFGSYHLLSGEPKPASWVTVPWPSPFWQVVSDEDLLALLSLRVL